MNTAQSERVFKRIDFDIVLKNIIVLPAVRIDRESFLRSALIKYYDEATVQNAISYNPAFAGIHVNEIKKIAKASINYETTKVSALSFVAGIPGGIGMVGTVPLDFSQHFGHILRILQKLVYLYGWQDLCNENEQIDDETAGILTLFVGVMFGVSGASGGITKIVEIAAKNVSGKIV